MYAINHAATALLIKKNNPKLPLFPLLVSVQLVEVFWVFFNYLGWEHFSISGGRVHLDFLPYSHSVFSGIAAAVLSFCVINWGYKNRKLALAFAIGVLSHVVIDVIFHEKDIQLSPFSAKPVLGLGILDYPILNFIIEFAYGIFCWWYFKGNKALLWVIIIFNIIDLPIMLAHGDALNPFVRYPFLLPSVILFQILITWYFVYRYAHSKDDKNESVMNEI
ncbi:hypothetical protein SAMN06265171_101269 [Chryseobacterium rhizoplanae]|uniref:Uncharacterized protein n=1 Tax=Chryseobacterium rhizoplanae TaxID=1609531 RepID=A0A521AM42_9FLAO|nr:hypothetical protein [Chryseobacterium rhizoplanae]SMO35877.1 hypothetical protein SAMN06265171_101269 [Chryseobacterium rhizoplanae]